MRSPIRKVTRFRRSDVGNPVESTCRSPRGTTSGESTYAVMIKPGKEILVGNGRRLRVLDVVLFEEEESRLVGLLQVEAA